jgi:hypothetical protein
LQRRNISFQKTTRKGQGCCRFCSTLAALVRWRLRACKSHSAVCFTIKPSIVYMYTGLLAHFKPANRVEHSLWLIKQINMASCAIFFVQRSIAHQRKGNSRLSYMTMIELATRVHYSVSFVLIRTPALRHLLYLLMCVANDNESRLKRTIDHLQGSELGSHQGIV